jgi:energy-coupling factor transport system permease protein
MFKRLRSKRNIYPLYALVSAILVFVVGLLVVKESWFFYFLSILVLIEAAFGYGKTLVYVLPVFLIFGLCTGVLSLAFATPAQALLIGLRTLLLGISVVPTLSMLPMDLVRCLNQLRCPRILSLGLLIALRFMPIMGQEIQRIRRAMKLRGVNAAWYTPGVWYRALLLPLVIRLLGISDTLSTSMETRAFVMGEQSSLYQPIHVVLRDHLFAAAILLTSAAALLGKFL